MPDPGPAGLASPAVTATSSLVWTAAGLAWVLAVPLFHLTKFLSVIPHEGGHALIAKLLLRKLDSIRFDRAGGGTTKLAGGAPWLSSILIGLAGYLGPSLFGLLAAELLIRGATTAVLWGSMAFLLLMLFAVRGPVGWVVVPSLLVAICALALLVPRRGSCRSPTCGYGSCSSHRWSRCSSSCGAGSTPSPSPTRPPCGT